MAQDRIALLARSAVLNATVESVFCIENYSASAYVHQSITLSIIKQ